jgi:hypothetical protein
VKRSVGEERNNKRACVDEYPDRRLITPYSMGRHVLGKPEVQNARPEVEKATFPTSAHPGSSSALPSSGAAHARSGRHHPRPEAGRARCRFTFSWHSHLHSAVIRRLQNNPNLTSPHLTSPQLTSPHLTSPHRKQATTYPLLLTESPIQATIKPPLNQYNTVNPMQSSK